MHTREMTKTAPRENIERERPHSVINTEAMMAVEKNMLMMMRGDRRSTRGTTCTAKDGIIYVSRDRIEDARFIYESVDMMDWQIINLPGMVNARKIDNI